MGKVTRNLTVKMDGRPGLTGLSGSTPIVAITRAREKRLLLLEIRACDISLLGRPLFPQSASTNSLLPTSSLASQFIDPARSALRRTRQWRCYRTFETYVKRNSASSDAQWYDDDELGFSDGDGLACLARHVISRVLTVSEFAWLLCL